MPRSNKSPLSPRDPIGCRWIDGDVKAGDWRYCQADQRPGSVYCEAHHARAYTGMPALRERDLDFVPVYGGPRVRAPIKRKYA